jgi:hypothetical protein
MDQGTHDRERDRPVSFFCFYQMDHRTQRIADRHSFCCTEKKVPVNKLKTLFFIQPCHLIFALPLQAENINSKKWNKQKNTGVSGGFYSLLRQPSWYL